MAHNAIKFDKEGRHVVPLVSGYSLFPVDITGVFGSYNKEDPPSLHERPPEWVVQEAQLQLTVRPS